MQIFRRIIVTAVISLITVCIYILTIGFSTAQVSAQNSNAGCSELNNTVTNTKYAEIYNANDNGEITNLLGCVKTDQLSTLRRQGRPTKKDEEQWFPVNNVKASIYIRNGWLK
jgi:hypothetical protein